MNIFYWYPKCTTCKKAKIWLEDHHVDYEQIDMVATPPAVADLASWMEKSELPIRRFFNTSGMHYREQGLKNTVNDLSIAEASEMLSKDGLLIKRPLLIVNGQAVCLGFKEETYEKALLSK